MPALTRGCRVDMNSVVVADVASKQDRETGDGRDRGAARAIELPIVSRDRRRFFEERSRRFPTTRMTRVAWSGLHQLATSTGQTMQAELDQIVRAALAREGVLVDVRSPKLIAESLRILEQREPEPFQV